MHGGAPRPRRHGVSSSSPLPTSSPWCLVAVAASIWPVPDATSVERVVQPSLLTIPNPEGERAGSGAPLPDLALKRRIWRLTRSGEQLRAAGGSSARSSRGRPRRAAAERSGGSGGSLPDPTRSGSPQADRWGLCPGFPPSPLVLSMASSLPSGPTLRASSSRMEAPDTYIGSVERHTRTLWVYEGDQMVHRSVTYVPGLYKIFDEILINAADNKQRDPSMDALRVEIDQAAGWICVYYNGDMIPVEVHREEGVYVPKLIFGHLLTSNNYDDAVKKTTGGGNGYGAKLTNIFSTDFVVETADGRRVMKYKQVSFLFKKLCLKLDALSHFHFAPKPVIEDMSIQVNVPALAKEEIAPLAVSDAAMLAPEEIFSGKGNFKEEKELTQADRKWRAKKKRKFKGMSDLPYMCLFTDLVPLGRCFEEKIDLVPLGRCFEEKIELFDRSSRAGSERDEEATEQETY